MNNYHQYFDLAELIAKHIKNELSAEETIELEHWLERSKHNRELFRKLTDETFAGQQPELSSVSEREKAWEKIARQTGLKKPGTAPGNKRPFFSYAAAIFLLLTIGLAINRYFDKRNQVKLLALRQTDILPGGNKAILTLADGTKIILDAAKYGKMASQQNIEISKTQNGPLVYKGKGVAKATENNIGPTNILTTPRGGQYEVILQDGTKIWLNAGSSIKYPVMFPAKERHIELTGEAYFEVAKDAAKPFFVKTPGQTVEVLGTHFNINGYTDEKTAKTTLLEGSVKVTNNTSGTVIKLRPGQQATENGKELKLIRDADINEAVAWKNGKFLFKDTDLQAIMRILARWYNVDVEYQGGRLRTAITPGVSQGMYPFHRFSKY